MRPTIHLMKHAAAITDMTTAVNLAARTTRLMSVPTMPRFYAVELPDETHSLFARIVHTSPTRKRASEGEQEWIFISKTGEMCEVCRGSPSLALGLVCIYDSEFIPQRRSTAHGVCLPLGAEHD